MKSLNLHLNSFLQNYLLIGTRTFLVSGLIDNRDIERMSRIPGLGSIPILGNLFKTRDVSKSLSELVVMVTPEVTLPINPGDPKPMIDFPNEFLVPLKNTGQPPMGPAASAAGAASQAAAPRSAKSKKK